MICCYLPHHGLRFREVYQLVEHKQCKYFSWSPEEVANAKCETDKYP